MARKSSKKALDALRQRLLDRLLELDIDQKELSLAAGKNHSYVNQFIFKGVPEKLPEDVRYVISQRTGLSPTQLGAPNFGVSDQGREWQPEQTGQKTKKKVIPSSAEPSLHALPQPEALEALFHLLLDQIAGEKVNIPDDISQSLVRDMLEISDDGRKVVTPEERFNRLRLALEQMLSTTLRDHSSSNPRLRTLERAAYLGLQLLGEASPAGSDQAAREAG